MNFETYLESKNIDSTAFKAAEPQLWKDWEEEFSHLHPASFTSQKLYLINPLRRLYQLPVKEKSMAPAVPQPGVKPAAAESTPPGETKSAVPVPSIPKPATAKPAIPRPVFKPKPKPE